MYRAALRSDTPGEISLVDFLPYEPSYGGAASFIGAPVFYEGKKVGVSIFQMPVDKINEIMCETAGLGETGETYLMANDFRMRSNSRFSEESTIFVQEVNTEAVKQALAGETGTMSHTDYRGTPVLAAFSPLNIEGLNWAILAEMDLAEVTASADKLKSQIAMIGLILTGIVSLIAFIFARSIVNPIKSLTASCLKIADGDLSVHIDVRSKDEIGLLGESFNGFTERLRSIITEIRSGTNQNEFRKSRTRG